MEYVIDLFLHLDVHLAEFVAAYGVWVYAMLFAIIFIETGLVIWPFLPGDSLLFAGGRSRPPACSTSIWCRSCSSAPRSPAMR
jgi:hypothetical protein